MDRCLQLSRQIGQSIICWIGVSMRRKCQKHLWESKYPMSGQNYLRTRYLWLTQAVKQAEQPVSLTIKKMTEIAADINFSQAEVR